MDELQLALLGKLEIRRDGSPIAGLSSFKAQALLCYLAVTGRPHFRTSLAGLLWGDMPETNARTNLRRELSSLRRAVGENLVITRHEVAFNRDAPYWLDVEDFEATAIQDTIEGLREAVELYRGDFLEGFYVREAPVFEEWVVVQQTRLRELELQALHKLSVHYAEPGEASLEEGIKYTSRLLALEPSREEAHRQLMMLLALSGQRGAALAQYEVCRQALAEDLGVEPGPETLQLYERIRDGEVGHWSETTPNVKAVESAARVPHNLPPQPTPFIGREEELADLDRLIAGPDARLITIAGPGGIGKTRLALVAAERQLEQPSAPFRHGVFFIPLVPLSSVDRIVPTIAEALGFQLREGAGRTPKKQLLDFLREKQMLLVIDSVDHLPTSPSVSSPQGETQGGAKLLVGILEAARDVKLLVTSRERLNLRHEQVFPLHGLTFPAPDTSLAEAMRFAAVKLFLQSARRVRPDFELGADQVPHLARICHLVGGTPLALELAAAWVDMLSLADIVAEITGEVGRGLDFLETEWRDVPERHRSMRAVIDASWEQLGTDARDVFRQLSVFRGGFTRSAAREVTGASLRTLTRLANRTLLFFDRDRARYQVHELLRQYGAEKLAADQVRETFVRDGHAVHYCESLQRWETDLRGARQQTALAEIEADIENIRAAWEWALARKNVDQLSQALDSLCLFYDRPFRPWEGRALCQIVIDKLSEKDATTPGALLLLAKALAWYTYFDAQAGVPSDPRLQRSLALLDNPILAGHDIRAERAFLLKMMGYYDGSTGRDSAALEQDQHLLEQSLSLWHALGNPWMAAHTQAQIATVKTRLGAYDQARTMYSDSLAVFRELGDGWMVVATLVKFGKFLSETNNLTMAHQTFTESLTLARAQGNRAGIAASLRQLTYLAGSQRDYTTAVNYAQEHVNITREAANQYDLFVALAVSGSVLTSAGDFVQAPEPLKEAISIAEELALPALIAWAEMCRARVSLATGRYATARTRAQKAIATVREINSQVMVARNLHTAGLAAFAEGKYKEAQRNLLEGIAADEAYPNNEYEPLLLAALGRTEYALGSRTEAAGHLFEALEITLAKRYFMNLSYLIPAVSVMFADEQQASLKERAVELYALASSRPFVSNSPFFEDIAGKHIAAATVNLSPDVIAAAQERGKALDWWETAETLLETLRELGWANCD